ncbi:hypothetical protein [Glaciimonas sp. PCH181]|uniref:hypothetical protein n=1 Tax=Glaciimonas sp. PCH181 TaxID=2133943 RepID=UPI000D3C1FB3|nr:hypothetical protein [Glaciimonas sp. PCH181]PUA18766.1 hypothetical protein C7W93_02260 [Glaciimonas sp. PCH181]
MPVPHQYQIPTPKKSVAIIRPNIQFLFHTFLMMIAMLMATSALAADKGNSTNLTDAKAAYQKQRTACLNGTSNEDRATCLREAGAALEAARKGQLNDTQAEYKKNRLDRCNALPERDRPDCLQRMKADGVVEGSAESGGILRESVTTEVGPPVVIVPGGK